MGDAGFSSPTPPVLKVKASGHSPFSRKGPGGERQRPYGLFHRARHSKTSTSPGRDTNPVKGKTSYYYVRGEQTNGRISLGVAECGSPTPAQ